MDNLQEISRMIFEPQGWLIGFRTWSLSAYDSNNTIICKVDKSERHNYLKYVRFIIALKNKGYKLRKCDRLQLKSGEKSFLIQSYISKAKKHDFYEIANIAGISNSVVDNIKNVSEIEQRKFAEMVGLEYHELIDNLYKW